MATPTLLTEQAVAELLAQAQPVPQAAPATPTFAAPETAFQLPAAIPQTRFFGGRSSSRTDTFTQQQRYRDAMMEQEADRQAQELASRLLEVDPAAEDAPRQRLNLLTQLPLSQSSDTGKTILSAWDKEADRFHKEVKDDKTDALLGELAEAGASPTELQSVFDASGRLNTVKARRTLGELKRLQEAGRKVTRTEEELTDDRIKALRDTLDFRTKNSIGDENENSAIEKEIFRLERERFGIPETPVAPAAGGVPVTPLGNTFQRSAPRPQ